MKKSQESAFTGYLFAVLSFGCFWFSGYACSIAKGNEWASVSGALSAFLGLSLFGVSRVGFCMEGRAEVREEQEEKEKQL